MGRKAHLLFLMVRPALHLALRLAAHVSNGCKSRIRLREKPPT
jgi:hypothetical protein